MKLMARDKFDNDGIDIEKQSQGAEERETERIFSGWGGFRLGWVGLDCALHESNEICRLLFRKHTFRIHPSCLC